MGNSNRGFQFSLVQPKGTNDLNLSMQGDPLDIAPGLVIALREVAVEASDDTSARVALLRATQSAIESVIQDMQE